MASYQLKCINYQMDHIWLDPSSLNKSLDLNLGSQWSNTLYHSFIVTLYIELLLNQIFDPLFWNASFSVNSFKNSGLTVIRVIIGSHYILVTKLTYTYGSWPAQTNIILFTAQRLRRIPAKIGDLRLGQIPPPLLPPASLAAAHTALSISRWFEIICSLALKKGFYCC